MFPLSIASGTLLTSRLKLPVRGGEWVLVRVMVRLVGMLPATKAVPLVLGRGVVGRYLFRMMAYSYPSIVELLGAPEASRVVKVTMGLYPLMLGRLPSLFLKVAAEAPTGMLAI